MGSALVLFTGRQSLFVESRRINGALDAFVMFIDGIAGLLFITGMVALIVYHWFPDPNREFSWRRKRRKARRPNH